LGKEGRGGTCEGFASGGQSRATPLVEHKRKGKKKEGRLREL